MAKISKGDWHENTLREVVAYLKNNLSDEYKVMRSHTHPKLQIFSCENDEKIGSNNRIADVDIIAVKNEEVKYIVEVQQKGKSPKDIVGIISAINIATQCSPYKKIGRRNIYPMKNIKLIIVTTNNKSQKKREQIELIKKKLLVEGGCIKKYKILEYGDFLNLKEQGELPF